MNWRNTSSTWQSCVNRYLSSAGLPRLPGYSKSRSRPSNPRVRINSIDVSINSFRLVCVANMAVMGLVPKFQPPTAIITFKSGLAIFMSITRWYLEHKDYDVIFWHWRHVSITIAYLKSPATRMSDRDFIQENKKETSILCIAGHLWGYTHQGPMVLSQRDQ